MKDSELCFYMIAQWNAYHAYIAPFLYCLNRAYPEASAFIDVRGELSPGNRELIAKATNNPRHKVYENEFLEYPADNFTTMALRWTQWKPEFEQFSGLYIGDIDIMLSKEFPTLADQQESFCEMCYSNVVISHNHNVKGTRLTGLHFIKPKEYRKAMKPVMELCDKLLLRGENPDLFWNEALGAKDNEIMLYRMIQLAGLPMTKNTKFLHHGIHLGDSRYPGRWRGRLRDDGHYKVWFKDLGPVLESVEFRALIEDETIMKEVNTVISESKMKDYSQHGEQDHILEFFKGQPTGRFLDIGAFDGMTNSNTRALSDVGWDGVCVEANPISFIKLLANHQHSTKVSCVNAAVLPSVKAAHFFNSREPQLATCLSKEHLGEWYSNNFWVSSITGEMIAAEFGEQFDFVSLDVEGVDLSVLATLGPVLKNTKLLCIEDCIPMHDFNQEYYDRLLAAAAAHGLSRVITRTKHPTGNTLLARP